MVLIGTCLVAIPQKESIALTARKYVSRSERKPVFFPKWATRTMCATQSVTARVLHQPLFSWMISPQMLLSFRLMRSTMSSFTMPQVGYFTFASGCPRNALWSEVRVMGRKITSAAGGFISFSGRKCQVRRAFRNEATVSKNSTSRIVHENLSSVDLECL